MNSPDTLKRISLPELEDGASLFDLLDGPMINPSGLDHVLVNHSAGPEVKKDMPTSVIFGRSSETLSRSVGLQNALASRLRARTDVNGSLIYALTWKHWDMSSGPPICALRARARTTSDKDFFGWPTPATQNATGGPKGDADAGNYLTLQTAAGFAGWPTPQVADGPNNSTNRGNDERRARNTPQNVRDLVAGWATPTTRDHKVVDQNYHDGAVNNSLPNQVTLAGWPTPMAGTPAQNGNNAAGNNDSSRMTESLLSGWGTPRVTTNGGIPSPDVTGKGSRLEDQAALAGWATPRTLTGWDYSDPAKALERMNSNHQINLSDQACLVSIADHSRALPARMEKRGGLNPAHSRWLMAGRLAALDRCSPLFAEWESVQRILGASYETPEACWLALAKTVWDDCADTEMQSTCKPLPNLFEPITSVSNDA